MARKIRFRKVFNAEEGAELVFCGPSNKDDSYAICINCPSCGEDIQIKLSIEDTVKLHDELSRILNLSMVLEKI